MWPFSLLFTCQCDWMFNLLQQWLSVKGPVKSCLHAAQRLRKDNTALRFHFNIKTDSVLLCVHLHQFAREAHPSVCLEQLVSVCQGVLANRKAHRSYWLPSAMTLEERVYVYALPHLSVGLQLQAFLILLLKVSHQPVLSSVKGERNVRYVKRECVLFFCRPGQSEWDELFCWCLGARGNKTLGEISLMLLIPG